MRVLEVLFDGYTQESRLLRLTTPLGRHELLAESVRGEEAISVGYTFTITALALDAAIPLKRLLGQPALLELATGGRERRPFHGHLTRVRFDGADGGMARYTLTLEPWTAFLSRGRDSRVFQNMSVLDVLQAVFAPYRRHARLSPGWRFELLDRAVYPVRSLVTQYQESDLAFAERLMSEEGLFYFFEHQGDRGDPLLGRHELVIADHNGAFAPNRQERVRFTQSGTVMSEDGMDGWQCRARAGTNAVDLVSWDYRALGSRPVGAYGEAGGSGDLVSRDAPGQYAYAAIADGERMAQRQLEAMNAQCEVYTGEGTVRTLAPATTFSLLGHALHDEETGALARAFCITRVWHEMRNNLSADERAAVTTRLGEPVPDEDAGERPMYRNRIQAVRANVPFRAAVRDECGQLLHPRRRVWGQQTAIVVGPEGSVIHTDRDHRVKIQFHWQRGARSHSRLNHPDAEGHSGAPADDTAGTWGRVATSLAPIAGANWGAVALPRVGQEVLVDFFDGDIDRPVVIAVLYNGAGAKDAQHNQRGFGAGVATGNAPAWFPGEGGAHAHPAVLSGLKSHGLQDSQSGRGGYSQLVFDSTAGQERVSLQRHQQTYDGSAEVNLGHLRHQTDNHRLGAAGMGAEIKTAQSAALRAGRGMLLTTEHRNGPAQQMDASGAAAQMKTASQLAAQLSEAAERHGVKAQSSRSGSAASKETQQADMQLFGSAGIVAATPASAIFNASRTSSITAGSDIAVAAQGHLISTVRGGVTLFTSGKAASGEKPNQETGIRLHAASGKVSFESQDGPTSLRADKSITVASTNSSVNIAAKNHILLTAQGAGIRIQGGNIELCCPGTIEFKAGAKELSGPQSSSVTLPLMPRSSGEPADQHFVLKSHSGKPVPNRRYRAYTGNVEIEGFTDEEGRSQLLDGYLGQIARF